MSCYGRGLKGRFDMCYAISLVLSVCQVGFYFAAGFVHGFYSALTGNSTALLQMVGVV